MKLAGCNEASIGIFAWSTIEPAEDAYDFDWLDTIMNKLAENGVYAMLATPSGARPPWLAEKYPEVLRTNSRREKELYGNRHNHCFSSPIYREKTQKINRLLAERYKNHPALIMWHISNEYSGDCHCSLCQENFRNWLRKKYDNDIKKLNTEWWTGFWSHIYTDWSQIQSPSPLGDSCVHGMVLDWKRFVTTQTIDFFKNEIVPIREVTPNIPVTTNFMCEYGIEDLDYFAFAKEVDVVSWDSYPQWKGDSSDANFATNIAFGHDMYRSMKHGKPFLLMESTPSVVNWYGINRPKRPSVHLLSSLQAIAHGADSVQYFQWRKGRGASEKFHGAVVGHDGSENTRTFRDVVSVGSALSKLDEVVGTAIDAKVGLIFDWENRMALKEMQGLRNNYKDYVEVCTNHYRSFWKCGIAVEVIDETFDFSIYNLLVAPMLYMLKPGVAQRIEEFVEAGGTFVATYWSGIVNENDLCFLGGFPGPLRKTLGIWSEEIDCLYDNMTNNVKTESTNGLGLKTDYTAKIFCDLIHTETAKPLATFDSDFYKGQPALTVNHLGKGKAYYICFNSEQEFLDDFYTAITKKLGLGNKLGVHLPDGVSISTRTGEQGNFHFVMNFTDVEKIVCLEKAYFDMLLGAEVEGCITLSGFGITVLKETIG